MQVQFNGVEFYLDNYLATNLDILVERNKKDWDNLGIIDGDEGAGKSTLAWGIGAYLSMKTGQEFTVDNIVFDPDELMRIGREKKNQVIIWDEAVIGGLSSEWNNKIQKKLIKILMTCRKNNHFWIFIIPKIFKLNKYIAEDRSFFLINVYSQDHISRGNYVVFNKDKKDKLLDIYYNTKKKRYDIYSFAGRFTKAYGQILDKEVYEKKKDDAIRKMDVGDENKKGKSSREINLIDSLIKAADNLKKFNGVNYTTFAKCAGMARQSLNRLRNERDEHVNSVTEET